jgi:hypothetical protein
MGYFPLGKRGDIIRLWSDLPRYFLVCPGDFLLGSLGSEFAEFFFYVFVGHLNGKSVDITWGIKTGYPLVNSQFAMENHHFQWENQLFLWPFSIANC